MYESSNWKLSGCASNLLAHEDLGHLRKPIIGIFKPSSIMKFPLVYESDNSRDSLYEEHGATLKHKCGKRIVTLPPFFFFFFSLFLGNALIMMIITLLFTYNSILQLDTRTKI